MCSIDKSHGWEKYRNKTQAKLEFLEKKKTVSEPFICYYRLPENRTAEEPSIVILETNTSLIDVTLWFFLPMLGIVLAFLGILFVSLWYCCPPQRKRKPEDYQEITGSEHDPAGVKEPL